MDIKKRIDTSNTPNFYSKEMIITKKSLNENQLKYIYQKQLISKKEERNLLGCLLLKMKKLLPLQLMMKKNFIIVLVQVSTGTFLTL